MVAVFPHLRRRFKSQESSQGIRGRTKKEGGPSKQKKPLTCKLTSGISGKEKLWPRRGGGPGLEKGEKSVSIIYSLSTLEEEEIWRYKKEDFWKMKTN